MLGSGELVGGSSAFAVVLSSAVSQAQAASHTVLPFAGFAFAVIYSLCGSELDVPCDLSDQSLVLSLPTLADLVDGAITSWSDARLVASNPWLATEPYASLLAPKSITLYGQSAEDEIMQTLLTLLQRYKPSCTLAAFRSGGGAANAATIKPTTELVKSAVIDTPLSMAVVPVTASIHRLLSVTPLEHPVDASVVTAPSSEAVQACANHTGLTGADGAFDGRFALAASADPGCYPLSSSVSIVMRSSFAGAECEGANALPRQLVEFSAWVLGVRRTMSGTEIDQAASRTARSEQAAPLEDANVAPLAALTGGYDPDTAVYIQERITAITCNGYSIFSLECSKGHIRKTSDQGTSHECEPCPAGTYALDGTVCVKVSSLRYSGAASSEEDVMFCPPHSRHQKLELADGEVKLLADEGATSASECYCDVDYYLLGGSCVACPPGATCRGAFFLPEARPGYAMLGYNDMNASIASGVEPLFVRCQNWQQCDHGHGEAHGMWCDCPGGHYNTSDAATRTELRSGTLALAPLSEQIGAIGYSPYTCGDAYKQGTPACDVCLEGYGKQLGHCERCESHPVTYWVAAFVYCLVWFPLLRWLITKHCKSLHISVAFIQFLGLYAEISLDWGSIGDFFAACAFFNLNLQVTARHHPACTPSLSAPPPPPSPRAPLPLRRRSTSSAARARLASTCTSCRSSCPSSTPHVRSSTLSLPGSSLSSLAAPSRRCAPCSCAAGYHGAISLCAR